MSNDDLDEVKSRARDIFATRAPAFLRWGEALYRAVDAVTGYAYREGKRAGHEEHQDERYYQRGFWGPMAENKPLLLNLLTLLLSSTAASGAAVTTIGPLVVPVSAAVVAGVVLVWLAARGFKRGGNRNGCD